jgi:hypothetical protein
MQEAHDQGVIHRDLKPSNILIDTREQPVIVDFGLARRTDLSLTRLTAPGTFMGTPAYMAPEQISGAPDAVDHRSDIYSLGVMLFELLSSIMPFSGPLGEVLRQKYLEPPPFLSTYRPDLPADLEQVCRKAMATRPEDRYPSMRVLASALRQAAGPALPPQASTEATVPGLGSLAAGPSHSYSTANMPVGELAVPMTLDPGGAAPTLREQDTLLPEQERKKREDLLLELEAQRQRTEELRRMQARYEQLKTWLAKSWMSRTYHQPVLVVGPRRVGKSSLVKQWHVPWDYSAVAGTTAHRVCEVPLLKYVDPEKVPHEAAPEVLVRLRSYLSLRVHDFPGELQAQREIAQVVREETRRLKEASQKNIGVVIICMFDAAEAHTGIGTDTNEYYNGELFRELRRLVAKDTVELARLVLVFNKFDLLRSYQPAAASDRQLLELCIKKFTPTCAALRGIVNRERVCEVLTVLSREDMVYKNQGASIVKGEAARPIIQAFRGKAVADSFAEPGAWLAAALGW